MTSQLQTAFAVTNSLREEISKVVIGQGSVIDELLIGLLGAGHVMIEGVPGLGKTLLARAIARCITGDFSRIQFTSDLMPSDVTGHAIYDLQAERFRLRKGPVFCHILLADEINRAPAKTQAALLEVMQETQVTLEGESYPLKAPFMVLATQNPIEQEGTYPLPEAQLDRFLLKIVIDYPSAADEINLVHAVTHGKLGATLDLSQLKAVLDPAAIVAAQLATAALAVDQQVIDYAVRIARASRHHPAIVVGTGPRGSIALIRAARGSAVVDGRDFISPDDIKRMARPVLRHRILLSAESQMEGRTADDLIDDLLNQTNAPRQ